MSNKLVTIAGIAAGIAIVTYVVLNVVAPFKPHDEKLQGGAKVEDVFSGDVASAPDIATPPDNQAPPKPAAEAPPSEDAPKDDAVAIEGASDFPMPAESNSPSEPPAAAPAPEPKPVAAPAAVATLPRPTPDPVLDSEAVAVAAPAPAPEPAAAAAEPGPAAAPEPPAPAAPPGAVAAPAPAAAPRAKPQADALTQWWPQRAAPGRLNLLYAGQAANERSIGLLFDSAFAEHADFGAGLKLIVADGKPASGSWELNSTRRMLLFKGLKPGRYTVIVSPQLANEAGLGVGSELHGPVYIR